MTLSDFYRRIGPLLLGRASANDAAKALWGERAPSPDAERLAIYGRMCRTHRFDAVDHVYAQLRRVLVERLGEPRWETLIEGYFRRYPMQSVELNENGGWLASYLREGGAGEGAPAFLWELADLEWWEWRTFIAPDSSQDSSPDAGPLRLSSTVELRAYEHDLTTWLDTPAAERSREPPASKTTVLFWRDAELQARRENTSEEELAILKCVFEGEPPRAPSLSAAEVGAIVGDLKRARVLLGQR